MTNWAILWKTWVDGELETPWDFQLVDHTNEYKRRTPPHDKVSDEFVESTYLSLNPSVVEQFELDYISAVILTAMIEADSIELAIASVLSVFHDAEIIKYIEVSPELMPTIVNMIKRQ